jgi:HNH endonuclease
MLRSFKPKKCAVCGKTYTPVGANQLRCGACPAPKCACGCGGAVLWSRQRKEWNDFIHNHHPQDRAGIVPWNKGNAVSYKHKCDWCGKKFANKFKEARFCSRKCFHTYFAEDRSPFWTGRAGEEVQYKFVQVGLGKWRREHRVVMAKAVGRSLRKSEVVHHIDGDGLNNDIDNLHLFHCDSCHLHHHQTGAPLRYVYGKVHSVAVEPTP